MDVIVLAGGKTDQRFRDLTGCEWRAEVPYEGRRFIDIVLGAVGGVGRIVQVGGPEVSGIERVPSAATFLGSVKAGLEAVQTDSLLLATSDLPDLSKEAVADFVARCDLAAGFNYPIVPMEECERAYPGLKRTTLAVREGRFTGGNLAVLRTEAFRGALPKLEAAYLARKSPLKLAGMVGIGLLARVVIGKIIPGTLPISALETAIGRFMGTRVRGIVSRYPEIGTDIDDADQYSHLIGLKKVRTHAEL
ncbi:MAG: NTP transferase domain-containing protein [Fimbriimonadaceae bacterium]|nr:NTP transferase domain-containing protein [Fimbriimonadaceae bacterium]QYK55946.1 MAG: NTP transferase domain-containing protein [Fimbriimonadaceae bacterium]